MPMRQKGPKCVSIASGNHRESVLAERNSRVEEFMHLVPQIAAGVARLLPPSFPIEDLIAEGYLGLMAAALRYRPKAHGGTPFEKYAWRRIRGAMLDSACVGRYRENTMPPLTEAKKQFIHPVVEQSIDQERVRVRMEAAITQLPDRLQLVIRSHYSEELSLVEISQMLEVNQSSAWRMHGRALRALREILSREPGADELPRLAA